MAHAQKIYIYSKDLLGPVMFVPMRHECRMFIGFRERAALRSRNNLIGYNSVGDAKESQTRTTVVAK